MRRQVIYSTSRRPAASAGSDPGRPADPEQALPRDDPAPRFASLRARLAKRAPWLRFFAGAAVALVVGAVYLAQQPPPRLSQEHVDAAVLRTLETKALPARAGKAVEAISPSVVRVRGFVEVAPSKRAQKPKAKRPPSAPAQGDNGKQPEHDGVPEGMEEMGVGSGVVVIDDGTILTNLHVINGTKLVKVTFHDGSESIAHVVSIHPENDLAVIKAQTIPDDLPAATLGSAGRLKPGDDVVVVGFPFGIGPSVSVGVVSGLDREFRSPKGERILTRLIQFDAAANPGNSGGPLVTLQGDVVGIVTAILNPTESGTFIGIGFAVTIGAAGRAAGMHPF